MARRKNLFVSWGGEESRQIATWLVDNVFEYVPEVKTYMSDYMPSGADWRVKLHSALSDATHCVGIVTDVSLNRPWFTFEVASQYLHKTDLAILRFCEYPSVEHPLSAFKCRMVMTSIA